MLKKRFDQVLWYKDGMIISQAIFKTKKEGKLEHHSLTIPSMSESDYGNYSCLAKNKLGPATDSIFLSGKLMIRLLRFKCSPSQEVLTNQG